MNLPNKLRNVNTKELDKKVFIGFDGFEDKIQYVVKSENNDEIIYYQNIRKYADAVKRASGRSSQFQLKTQVQKLGGNAPIMAHALGTLGIPSTLMASLGYPELRPVFKELHELVNKVSVCDPGETNALEFHDGKLILSEMSSFKDLNWCSLLDHPGHEKILEEMNSSDIIALVDWSNLANCSDIWEGIYKDILPALNEPKAYFFDIADPSRASSEELEEVLEIIASYTVYGEVYLGINENESFGLYEKIFRKDSSDLSLEDAGSELFKLLKIKGLLIHPIGSSYMISSEGIIKEESKIVKEPKLSTGGGDNFNAGFCLGLLLGFDISESMKMAMATSGAYVKDGVSPSLEDTIHYLEN